MSLVITKESPAFALGKIAVGDFVRARHRTWKESINGIVVYIDSEMAQIVYLPKIHRATRYFTIRAQEVQNSEWAIAHSRDLASVEKVEMTNGYD
jgi:hypothetical protein